MAIVEVPSAMSAALRIPARLSIEGDTVADVLENLCQRWPGARNRLFTPAGTLHRFINVFIDGKAVSGAFGLDRKVGVETEVFVMTAVAGG